MKTDPTRYRVIDTKTGNVLGYTNSSKAIADHCKEAGITKRDLSSGGQMPSVPARTTVDALAVQVERALDQPNVTQ